MFYLVVYCSVFYEVIGENYLKKHFYHEEPPDSDVGGGVFRRKEMKGQRIPTIFFTYSAFQS